MTQRDYTVVGIYEDNGQRYCGHVWATSPEEAERNIAEATDGDLLVAGVFEGKLSAVDCDPVAERDGVSD